MEIVNGTDGIDTFNQFVAMHLPQLQSSGVPQHLWKTLHFKLEHEIFDAGSTLSVYLVDYENNQRDEQSPVSMCFVTKRERVMANNPNEIYLIDHAWTFQLNEARSHLDSVPQLGERMAKIMGINTDDVDRTEKILHSLWKYCQFYSVQGIGNDIESRLPVWYMMDEVGCSINHSEEPNFRIVPFLHLPSRVSYSLLFPIVDCEEMEEVTRDFAENIPTNETMKRKIALLPWKKEDFTNYDFIQKEPSEEYFLANRRAETMPAEFVKEPHIENNRPLKVYSEYDVINRSLTAAEFEVIDNSEEADILWLTKHYDAYLELSTSYPNKFINQFPHECIITVKDLLSIVCRRASKEHHNSTTLETYPKWLPTTYNLKTECTEFVSYFQNRTYRDLDNHWIIKPFNLARSLDTYITRNLNKIIRLSETAPKIAQKYIENPVLFYRSDLGAKVKFDIRYVIALKKVQPLEVYTYKKFFLRFANKPFSLDDFEDYEKHFTVMNYTDNVELRRIEYDEFINLWNRDNPEHNWNILEDDIHQMFKELFDCATQKKPPVGIAPSPQSRAIYAADIMLSWEGDHIQPKLLEINWMPDCKRASEYYPEFFNDIFKLLFLDEVSKEFRAIT